MSQSIMLKSNKYGINLILDDQIEFDQLLRDIIIKFKEAESFFKDSKMALSFEGRKLSHAEERRIVEAITSNSSVNIVCILDNDAAKAQMHKGLLESQKEQDAGKTGQFYRGTLRGGQKLESETSLVILGDVHPGAKVISRGNIVILGALKGTAYAGAEGNRQAFVAALDMDPVQIKIGDVIGRSADKALFPLGRKKKRQQPAGVLMDPQVAIVKNANIFTEPITKGLLNNL